MILLRDIHKDELVLKNSFFIKSTTSIEKKILAGTVVLKEEGGTFINDRRNT